MFVPDFMLLLYLTVLNFDVDDFSIQTTLASVASRRSLLAYVWTHDGQPSKYSGR